MKFTNKYNLPQTVFDVLAKDGYKAGNDDYSATSLLKSPRQLLLYRRHFHQIEEDVSDRVWSIFGQAAHNILEKHGNDTSLTEERLYTEVLGRKLSGQVDHYHEGVITDYKVTSVWSIVYKSKIEDWTAQLNIYAYLFRKNGYDVRRLQIVAVLRDWSETEKLRSRDYPEAPIVVIPITLWDIEDQELSITSKIKEFIEAESLTDDELPYCTPEERWQAPDVYAVMKEGRKTAVKLYDNEEEAEIHASEDKKYSVVKRSGTSRNCERYCPVSFCCNQYAQLVKRNDS